MKTTKLKTVKKPTPTQVKKAVKKVKDEVAFGRSEFARVFKSMKDGMEIKLVKNDSFIAYKFRFKNKTYIRNAEVI